MSKPKWKILREQLLKENKIYLVDGIEMYDTPFGRMCVNPNDTISAMVNAAKRGDGFYGQSIS